MSNIVAPHPSPVWQCDSLIVADLSKHGMPGRYEQFWTRRLDDTLFEIACIPFFTYGISLGDIVCANEKCVVERVAEKRGHKTLRVAIANRNRVESLHGLLHAWVERSGLLYEWHQPGYLAVDVPPALSPEFYSQLLAELRDIRGISVETDE